MFVRSLSVPPIPGHNGLMRYFIGRLNLGGVQGSLGFLAALRYAILSSIITFSTKHAWTLL